VTPQTGGLPTPVLDPREAEEKGWVLDDDGSPNDAASRETAAICPVVGSGIQRPSFVLCHEDKTPGS
jgi:hypothetical protein